MKSQADVKYREFHSSLVPNEQKESFIGVRMPILRKIGKEISKGNAKSYLKISCSNHYEERMLRGIVTGLIKAESFSELAQLCDSFSEEVNNWAICDCFCSGLKQIKRYKSEFFEHIEKYLNSGNDWKIRIALVVMLNYYLDDEYIDRVLERCDGIKSDYYYVSMAQAWLVSTAVVKCRDKAIAYLRNNNLDGITVKRAIQKCIDSYRIDADTKLMLKGGLSPLIIRVDSVI